MLMLVGGVAGYLGGTTTVRLVDDGVARTVRTYATTVRGLLHHTGISVGKHDKVTPPLSEAVPDGGRVVIARGRPVTLTLDGVTRRQWLTTRTVAELLTHLKLDDAKVRMSASRDAVIPRTGMRITIRTEKHLTLIADGKKTELTTYAATPAELYQERNLTLGKRDESKPPFDATLAGVTEVRLIRVTVKKKTETVTTDPPVKVEKNPEWMEDQQMVIEEGQAGKAEQVVEYIYRDGEYSERKVLSSKTLVEPKPRVVKKGTKPYPPDDTGLNWEALAECESGGNPRAVSPNGLYHGLYQFSVDTWRRMGGIGLPSQATPREQTYRAILLYKRAGADQWPHCGPRLFT